MLNEKLNKLNIDQSRFEQVFTPDVRKVADVLRKYGFDVRVVGGAVRGQRHTAGSGAKTRCRSQAQHGAA